MITVPQLQPAMAMRRVELEDLLTLQRQPSCMRNICVLAHVDHGKVRQMHMARAPVQPWSLLWLFLFTPAPLMRLWSADHSHRLPHFVEWHHQPSKRW